MILKALKGWKQTQLPASEGTLRFSADQVAFEEHPANKDFQIFPEKTVAESHTTLTSAIAGTPCLIKDAVTILVTMKTRMK